MNLNLLLSFKISMRITMSTIANIFSVVYLGYISILIFFYAKGKVKLMLNPILSIMQGIMVTFSVNYLFLAFIQNIAAINLYIIGMILAFSIFIGGFVATIFSRDNNALFGVITGIIFASFILIVDYKDFMAYNITMKITIGIIIVLIVSLLPGGIGGFIARKSKESIIKRTDTHIDEYIYCIGRCASLNSKYNQLINGENIHVTDFIYECEDLLGKFNGLNDLGQSNEINKSIMIGTVKNMIVHVKRNYQEK
jgi:hypothetical protein